SLSRAFNLAEKADASVEVDASLFENDQEKALSKAIEELELTGSASDKLAQLFALSPVIDAFFDNTMVMADDVAVKNNRLALLSALVAKAKAVAAFNQLNTK
ncbi:MAG: DALR anticodon-binding domain-containing protein, partial [Streptococcus sp.]|nr:DALR anticodon-binding domain-containing protein [Streptococcus sp.]